MMKRDTMRRVVTAVGAAALVAGMAPNLAAQESGRIRYSTYTLSNGLRVVFAPDASTPIVSVNMWYHVGSANERLRRSGFAHLFEHMMFQGSANVRKAEHFQLVERAGGELNGSTWPDYTNYYQTLPSNRLNLALWLEADRMRSLAITAENFENQRQAVKEERRLRVDNQPYAGAIQDAFTMPYDSTACFAYAHTPIGSMDDLDSAALADVQAFFNQFYRPANAVLTVAGDFDDTQARALIQQYFGDIPAGTAATEPACQVRYGAGARRFEVTDRNANLPAVVYVYPLPPRHHPDSPALDLLGTIVGGGESSRINRAIVREATAAVAAGAFSQLRRHSNVGLFFAVANQGVAPARLDTLLGAQMDQIRSAPISEEELTKARNQYRAGAIRSRQSTMGVAENLQAALRFFGDLEAVNTEINAYMAVTAADIQRVARTYLGPENRLTVVVNPPVGGNE